MPRLHQTLLLSGQGEDALVAEAGVVSAFLRGEASVSPKSIQTTLDSLCYTAAHHRPHHDHRLVVLGGPTDDIARALECHVTGERTGGSTTILRGQSPVDGHRKTAFVFSGQGGQWLGMGRHLRAREPVFAHALERCDAAVAQATDCSIVAEIDATPTTSRLDRIEVIQPAIFAIQVALAELWRARGVCPDVVVGHSLGEIAAAHVAGILSLDDAARIVCEQSRALARLCGQGAMLMVELDSTKAQALAADYPGQLDVAIYSGPRSIVLSGDEDAIADVQARLDRDGLFARRVKVDVAAHSPQIDPLCAALRARYASVQPRPGTVPMLSASTLEMCSGVELDGAYWSRSLRAPVQFYGAMTELLRAGCEVFVELSPHPIVQPSIAEAIRVQGSDATVIICMRRGQDEERTWLTALAGAFVCGAATDTAKLVAGLHPGEGERMAWPEAADGSPHCQIDSSPGASAWQPLIDHLRAARPGQASALVHDFLVAQLAALLEIPTARVDLRRPLGELGLDSLRGLELRNRLEDALGLQLSTTLLWRYPTGADLIAHLVDKLALAPAPPTDAPASESRSASGARPVPASGRRSAGPRRAEPSADSEPIAIVGMGCRFPGQADNPAAYWRLLRDGVDAIGEVPAGRWDPDPPLVGKSIVRWGGFVADIDRFDPYAFRLTPREAASMDPQQRLFLEVAWEALEDAGRDLDRLAGSRTSVFAGAYINDYALLDHGALERIDGYTGTGNWSSFIAGRLSYLLDLRGPCMAVHTACSSALVAVHLACQSLRRRESDLAVAGGVNAMLQPQSTLALSTMNALSPTGRCKTFDAAADGFVRGEGCGVVALARLSDALAAGDRIWALIRGTAVNQDGRSTWLTAPNGLAQEDILQTALADAGVAASDIGYVEAHGTGTQVGDPIEVEALIQVLDGSADSDARRPCWMASCKTNIGHLESAAGIAGLIKTALCLHHEAIPPHLHLQELNPQIDLAGTRFVIPRELTPWPRANGPRNAGVSAFGMSGVNAHAVLAEAPLREPTSAPTATDNAEPHVLPLSAHNAVALDDLINKYRAMLADSGSAPGPAPGVTPTWSLADLCSTAGARRAHREHRAAIVASSLDELGEKLAALGAGRGESGVFVGRASTRVRPVFVFSGQGGQWVGMGRELSAREPVFADALDRCEAAMQPHVDWSLRAVLDGDGSALKRIDVIQPTLFSMQVALTALLASWGIEPGVVLGHSMGEVAAAYVSGGLSFADAVRLICLRSRLLRRLSGQGAMALIELSPQATEELLRGREHLVSPAVSTSRRATVISGDPGEIEVVMQELEARSVFCRRVKIDVASHSPQVEVLRPDLLAALSPIEPRNGHLPMYSTVTSAVLPGAELDPEYWMRNLREPVRLAETLAQVRADGGQVFVEISPHPVLLPALEECLADGDPDGGPDGDDDGDGLAVAMMRREQPERENALAAAAALYTRGAQLNWDALTEPGAVVSLPTYPWQRERLWRSDMYTGIQRRSSVSSVSSEPGRARSVGALGEPIEIPGQERAHRWQQTIGVSELPYLEDHRVAGAVITPGVLYLDLMSAAVREVVGPGPVQLVDIAFENALALTEDSAVTTQVVYSDCRLGAPEMAFYSRDRAGAWQRHARATVARSAAGESATDQVDLAAVRTRCPETLSGAEHCRRMAASGLDYGPAFKGVRSIALGDNEALAELLIPPAGRAKLIGNQPGRASNAGSERLHPALVDAGLQALVALLPETGSDDVFYLPVAIGSLHIPDGVALYGTATDGAATGDGTVWSHAILRQQIRDGNGDSYAGDVTILDASGRVLVEIRGLRLKTVGEVQARSVVNGWLYQTVWRDAPLTLGPDKPDARGTWIVLVDQGMGEDAGEGAVGDAGESVGRALCTQLRRRGARCIAVRPGPAYEVRGDDARLDPVSRDQWAQLLADVQGADGDVRGVLCLWALDAPDSESLTAHAAVAALDRVTVAPLYLAQAILSAGFRDPPGLLLVTRNACAVADGPIACIQAPLWGLGQTIALEHPELSCTCVDLGEQSTADAATALVAELANRATAGSDNEIAVRADGRRVARLVRCTAAELAADQVGRSPGDDAGDAVRSPAGERAFRLTSRGGGSLDALVLRAVPRPAVGPGQVEIEVAAAGLNFLDVLNALDVLPLDRLAFGLECAGVISAIGEGVTGWTVGQEVIAVANGSLGRFVATAPELIVARPAAIPAAQAAGIPIAFATAYHALHHIGRLAPGERVLIHAATGGVGMAAVQIARNLGAEIFATAGSDEKRALLRSMGIDQVFDSRSTSFARGVWDATDGEGIDVVLNSLAGEFIPLSLSLLRDFGRFVEIGKRDYFENRALGLQPFLKNLSFSLVDLAAIWEVRPAQIRALLTDLMALFADGVLQPLPTRTFAMSEAGDAFRLMARAGHIGKLTLSVDTASTVPIAAAERPGTDEFTDDDGEAPRSRGALSARGTYLITGGCGGLGLAIARSMVESGVRHLALVGRSGADDAARAAIAEMQQLGAQVRVIAADVTVEDQVAALIRDLGDTMPALRGVIHAAGVLDDGAIARLDGARMHRVLAPKVLGAINLHRCTREHALDLFVLFSSVTSLIGAPGQGNYAAANSFLDALAHHRRATGRPALSINWGPWADVGMAAAQDSRGARLDARGIGALSVESGCAAFLELLAGASAQMGVMSFDLRQWRQYYPKAAGSPRYAEIASEVAGADGRSDGRSDRLGHGVLLRAVRAAPSAHRRALIEDHICEQLVQVLRIPAERVGRDDSFRALGLDSLMAIEFRNRLESSTGLTLSATMAWSYPTPHALADELARQMVVTSAVTATATATGGEASSAAVPGAVDDVVAVEQLSGDEVANALAAELAALELEDFS